MGCLILLLLLLLFVGIPSLCFWAALVLCAWSLWSISGPVPASKREMKGSP